jgi:hypothetical protein
VAIKALSSILPFSIRTRSGRRRFSEQRFSEQLTVDEFPVNMRLLSAPKLGSAFGNANAKARRFK